MQVGIFDKQPADIRPEQTDQRTVRVGPVIGAVMVQPMGGHPPGGRILETADRDNRKTVLKPQRTAEAAVAEQPVVTEIDPGGAEDIDADDRQRDAGPAEEPGTNASNASR